MTMVLMATVLDPYWSMLGGHACPCQNPKLSEKNEWIQVVSCHSRYQGSMQYGYVAFHLLEMNSFKKTSSNCSSSLESRSLQKAQGLEYYGLVFPVLILVLMSLRTRRNIIDQGCYLESPGQLYLVHFLHYALTDDPEKKQSILWLHWNI